MKELYVIDYDLPPDKGRRQFYRHLNRILKDCTWTKSSQSVILVDNFSAAYDILQLAKAYNAPSASMYKVSRSSKKSEWKRQREETRGDVPRVQESGQRPFQSQRS